jgi:CRP/FNR family transcriptional regulator, cyclic AMP receptor protein
MLMKGRHRHKDRRNLRRSGNVRTIARATDRENMSAKRKLPSSSEIMLADAGKSSHFAERETIYAQGAASSAIFYVQSGMVMLTVRTKGRRPSVIAVLPAGNFFNEASLTKHSAYLSTATTLVPSSILVIKTIEMVRLLHDEKEISLLFRTHMLAANTRFREDLLDVLGNSASQRLARALLRLANISSSGSPRKASIPRISQLALAEMVGTTRSRVNFFMNSFRKSGYISYNGMLEVRSTLRQALANHSA